VLGLSEGTKHKSKRGVVTRMARALDQQSSTGSASFSVEWHDGALKDEDGAFDVATIRRRSGSGSGGDASSTDVPVLDCYAYVWAGDLNDRWAKQNRFRRAFRLFTNLLAVPPFIRFFKTGGKKNQLGRAQLIVAYLLVVVVLLYFAILVWALAQTGMQFWDKHIDPSSAHNKTGDDGATSTQWTALITTAIAAFWPTTRKKITAVGTGLAAAASYIRMGDGRARVVGGLDNFIEQIRTDNAYDRVTILAYSFGSIIAIDALFPENPTNMQSFKQVSQLVTIGSPFDFVRALRPSWYSPQTRHAATGVPERWLNIYSRVDLMGSNYRTDKEGSGDPLPLTQGNDVEPTSTAVQPTQNEQWEVGVEPSLLNLLEFYGFASHGMYWGMDNEEDRDVFLTVVAEVYAGSEMLT
jgi:hypothetical protein